MNGRGTRPKGPRRWTRRAEGQRVETLEIGQELVRLARDAKANDGNKYLLRVILAEVETLGERIQRLMLEAAIGEEPEE